MNTKEYKQLLISELDKTLPTCNNDEKIELEQVRAQILNNRKNSNEFIEGRTTLSRIINTIQYGWGGRNNPPFVKCDCSYCQE